MNEETIMREEPLVSVIVPVYKVEQYLDECMQSIVSQTYRNLEIIVVDDGSPDSCPEKCEEWAARDSRIHVVHKENGGLSSARNAGIRVMHGRYVSFVDSDDIIELDMLEIMVDDIQQQHATIVVCGSTIIDENGSPYPQPHVVATKAYTSTDALLQMLYCTNYIPNTAWGKLYDRSLFEGMNPIRFPDGLNSEDYYFNSIAYWRSQRVYVDGRQKYRYRKRSGSICTTMTLSEHTFDKITIADITNDQLRQEGFIDEKALQYHQAARCFDVLYTVLTLNADKKAVGRCSKKLRPYALKVLMDSRVSICRRIKILVLAFFPHAYYFANKLVNNDGKA